MSSTLLPADGHGPEWATAVADLSDRAGAVFGRGGDAGCVSVVDMEPSRMLDAWWLRRRLDALAALSGRAVRYVPCTGPSLVRPLRGTPTAPAWAVGAAPVALNWAVHTARPLCAASGTPWIPDGPVLILAGSLAQRLPREVLLSHQGAISTWRGEPGAKKWEPMDLAPLEGWMADSLRAYPQGLPSSMLSWPIGYWQFLEQALAWAPRGCMVLARSHGWSSLAEIREDAARGAHVSEETPPVNFHWIAQNVQRIGGMAQTVHAHRDDTVQLVAGGLPDAGTIAALCAPLSAAMRSSRTDRARAARTLAAAGDIESALAVLQARPDDPALLRATWETLTTAVASAGADADAGARVGAWLGRLMADNPWINVDAGLLRAAGHLGVACGRVDLALSALRALETTGRALAPDLVVLARCLELTGQGRDALAICDRALARTPGDAQGRALRERVAQRQAAQAAPWRVPHELPDSPLVLEPLDAGHASALKRQMRDPSIPAMTVLPVLEPQDDGTAWIAARNADTPAAWALVHRQLGFVGYVDLRVWQTTAFICYWIGADYQGMRFCGRAIALARSIAVKNGVDTILSSAFDDNTRSLRALRKAGFQEMDVRALEPDHNRTFILLRLGAAPPMTQDEGRQRLIDFCENTGSGLRFTADARGAQQPSQ